MSDADVEIMPLPEEWLTEDLGSFSMRDHDAYRAVLCMEHLIRDNYNGDRLNIVEIGPFPAVGNPTHHTAPISLISKRNPEHNYISFGAVNASDYTRKQVLGDVEYIHGLLSLDPADQVSIDLLMKRLGAAPDIIYGQHVFENSWNTPKVYMPTGSFIPFEKSTEMLKDEGIIIVDNHSGLSCKIGMDHKLKHSSRMKLAYSYIYDIDKAGEHFYNPQEVIDPFYGVGDIVRGIYAFRKMNGTGL